MPAAENQPKECEPLSIRTCRCIRISSIIDNPQIKIMPYTFNVGCKALMSQLQQGEINQWSRAIACKDTEIHTLLTKLKRTSNNLFNA